MKNILRNSLVIAGLLLSVSAAQASDTYAIDPNHTSVAWTINHFGFSHPWGKFSLITGSLDLDDQTPQNTKLFVTIPIANLYTGVEKLDEHLKSKTFFDMESFPTATFISTRVTPTGKDTATVDGTLTLHGVAKPMTLYVTLNKIGKNMMGKQTAGFSATATIKRSDYGINAYLPDLGDEVKLFIESEANL